MDKTNDIFKQIVDEAFNENKKSTKEIESEANHIAKITKEIEDHE